MVDFVGAYARFPLPRHGGPGRAAIADGTHVPLRENNLLGCRHILYGGYGAIAYHHIADSYVALFTTAIPCGVWEAVHILDGLLKNESCLQPDSATRYEHIDALFGGDPVEQEKTLEYASLVANAIMLSNVVDMSDAIEAMVGAGETVTPEPLSATSPYLREHIRRFGQYVLDVTDLTRPLDPRPPPLTKAL